MGKISVEVGLGRDRSIQKWSNVHKRLGLRACSQAPSGTLQPAASLACYFEKASHTICQGAAWLISRSIPVRSQSAHTGAHNLEH